MSIAFRGLRKDNGEMVFGNYFHNFRKGESHNIIDFDSNVWYEVIPETVGQYTGLKDKNEVKIFSGDVVELFGWGRQAESNGLTAILWDNDTIGWNFERSSYGEDRYDFRKAVSNCLIKGNIHQNAELLKKS